MYHGCNLCNFCTKKEKYFEESDIARSTKSRYNILLLFTQETIRLPNNSCWVATRQSGGAQRTRRRRRIQSSWGRAGEMQRESREAGQERDENERVRG